MMNILNRSSSYTASAVMHSKMLLSTHRRETAREGEQRKDRRRIVCWWANDDNNYNKSVKQHAHRQFWIRFGCAIIATVCTSSNVIVSHAYVWCPRNSDCASGLWVWLSWQNEIPWHRNDEFVVKYTILGILSCLFLYPLHSIHTLDSREFSFQNERKENMKWKRMKTHDNRNPNTHNECDRVKNTEKTRHLHLRREQAQYGSRIRWYVEERHKQREQELKEHTVYEAKSVVSGWQVDPVAVSSASAHRFFYSRMNIYVGANQVRHWDTGRVAVHISVAWK